MAEKSSRAKSAMSGGKKSGSKKKSKSGKKVRAMHIRHAANGGYVINHDMAHEPGEMPGADEDQPHVAGGMDELLSHVQDHMQPPPEQQEPAPQPGASAPNPMAMMGGGGQ